jgi:threonine aldolase
MSEPDLVDLRSDTVTRPTDAMRRVMADAEVGDDGYGEDPTVNRLEAVYAERVGKEMAVYVPSGTMANQIALRLLGRPGTKVVAGAGAHVVAYEHGAAGTNSPVQFGVVDDADGTIDPAVVADAIVAHAHHHPEVSAVFVEDTHMPSGGRPWPAGRLAQIAALDVPIHLDGARLFNAAVATGTDPADRARPATTVMTCLSKGLGAPVGSLIAGPADLMIRAREERKRLGGAMRQAGIVAAGGIYALDHHVDRLAEDHERARALADAVAARWPDTGLDPTTVRTNVVVFRHADAEKLVDHLASRRVLSGLIGPGLVRLMTHLDLDDAGLDRAIAALADAP